MKLATLKILESGYTIRFARAEELTLLIETIDLLRKYLFDPFIPTLSRIIY